VILSSSIADRGGSCGLTQSSPPNERAEIGGVNDPDGGTRDVFNHPGAPYPWYFKAIALGAAGQSSPSASARYGNQLQ
jgi:hypothetical protein